MVRFLRQALRWIEREWRQQAAIHQLNKLDDELLADIGLRRGQLPLLNFEAPDEAARLPSPEVVYRPELVPCG
jgi:uncharacterized protein YjiS (DUF1127 family)